MTPHAPGTAAPSTAAGPVVLPGTPVVPGVAWGPVVRPSGAVALPGDDGVVVREEERAGEKERFTAAAGVVADRLNARAGAATGVSAEVLANALAPADTAGLDTRRITGMATRLGGTTSHTAIIARQLGLPCVVAVGGLADDPEEARARLAASQAAAAALAGYRGPGRTRDGLEVKVLANVQDGAGARAAAAAHAEGVGLLRTELAFLSRAEEPSVEEQASGYAEVFEAFPGQRVVVRTLDAGSDKPLAFATMPDEENPALGVRGLRVARRDPGLLERQLDAIAEGARRAGAEPWVMAPMVATVAEAADFAARVRARGLTPGVMIEVPSAALMAERLLQHVDFLSIGTNDLSQYTLAADRLSADLADLTDPWQPALLALVQVTADAGRRARKPVGVCGEAAADPLLARGLVGLGITSLSCAASAIAGVGARLAVVDTDACRRGADSALLTDDPHAARAVARRELGGE